MADWKFTAKEQEKVAILTAAIEGEITNSHAAKQLRLSVRQVQRAKARIRKNGAVGIVHQLKGKPSNHRISPTTKKQALALIKQRYVDFKPTFATEKLQKYHNISVSPETTRLWMIAEKVWKTHKQQKPVYRSWRPRKEYYGELQQFDGSYHWWFEKRFVDEKGEPIEVCLLASIDDAIGKITKAEFTKHEGVIPVFTFWKSYVEEIGKPISIYLDQFSTYKINHKNAVDNSELITQFERAMQQLAIELITAHSPEAKGRIERLFLTLQDRLVKEMRLGGINTPETGNKFLKEVFIPEFNARFAVVPVKEGDVHTSITDEDKTKMVHIFSIHETRRVNNDFTIQFKNNWYQLTEIQPTTVWPLARIVMETWLDGSIHIILKGYELVYILLAEKPKKQRINQPIILTTHALNYKPPVNHPWRKRILPLRE